MTTNKQDAMAQFPMSDTSLRQSLSKLSALQGMATPTMPRPGNQSQFYFLPEAESRSALSQANTSLPANQQDAMAMAQPPMSNSSLPQLNALQGMATSSMPATPTMPRPSGQSQFYFLPEAESRSALPQANTSLPANQQDAMAMAQPPMSNSSLSQLLSKLNALQGMATPGMPTTPTTPRPGGQSQLYFLPEVESRSALPQANMSLPTNEQDVTAMAQPPMSNSSLPQLNALQGMATPTTPAMPGPGDQSQFYFLPEAESRSALSQANTSLPANQQDAMAMAQPPMSSASLPQSPSNLGALQGMATPGMPTIPRPGDQPQFYFLPEVESRSALPQANMSLPTNEQDAMAQLPMSNTGLLQSLSKLNALQGLATPGMPTMPHPGNQPQFYFLPEVESRSALPKTNTPFDVHAIRQDFPILHQNVNGNPLIWLDNAATSQKPLHVIDALSQFYMHDNSNVHRGAHTLAARSTDAYEGAREKVQRFLGAQSAQEIIFVRGTTEGINLVAQTYGRKYIGAGDEIVLTTLEHHSNIVPWQLLAQETGAVLRVAPIDERGEVMLEEYERLLGPRTRLVAISHVSNALGTVLPVAQMAAMAHRYGARILVDGAQAVPHFRVNVQAMDADFYTFSGHKLFGPTGIGALYGKLNLLEDMPPWQGGGSMIDTVTFEETTYNSVPYKFEAGTGDIAGAVGLGAAIDYLDHIGFEAANLYEEGLMAYATEALASIAKLRQIGTAPYKVSVLSFVLDGTRPEDVGTFLDKEGIAVRAGHHCAQPTMSRYGLTGTVRPSLAFYNTYEEIDALVSAILKYKKLR